MAVLEGGTSAALADVGVAAASPLHVNTKPTPYGALGHYALTAETGLIAAGMGADGELLQFRWTDATRFAVIYEVGVTMFRNNTTAFAAGNWNFKLTIARGWTAVGTGGGTLTLTGDNNQLRTSMGASLVQEIRVATTAALGIGTKTLDVNNLNATYGRVPATANISIIPPVQIADLASGPGMVLFSRDPGSEHPIVVAQNEGFVIRANVPATGTWNAGFWLKWCEVASY